jgi:hypothetical protein
MRKRKTFVADALAAEREVERTGRPTRPIERTVTFALASPEGKRRARNRRRGCRARRCSGDARIKGGNPQGAP